MLLEDDPLAGITTPSQYRHIRLLKFVLRTLGGWPGEKLGETKLRFEGKYYTYFCTSVSFQCLVTGIIYLQLNLHRLAFLEVGHMYITVLMNILTLTRAMMFCMSKQYWHIAVKFITKVHLFHHKHKTEFSMQMHNKVHRISHNFSVYLMMVLLVTWLIFNGTPIYNNFALGKYEAGRGGGLANGTFELAVYFWMPFEFETNINGYVCASIYGCGYICTMDVFLSLMIFHLWGHFKILVNNVQTSPKPEAANGMYSDRELVCVAATLKDNIQYHHFIASFTNEISEAFGFALLVYLAYYQACGCLLLLECSQKNTQALVRYVPLTVLMFQQLIQVSLIFETIGTVSEQLKDAVYCMPWEGMDSRCRKSVLLLLLNVQEPIHVKAGGLVNVGVTTMASIIKTSLSYFAFLRTVSH